METLQKKIGKKSAFGGKVRLPRPRPDLHWDSNDKIDQYKCVEQIFKLNSQLEQAKHDADFNEKKRLLTDLEQKVKEQELRLNELRAFEYQQIKGLLKERKESIDPKKSGNQMLEHYKCKLFDKRKALDLLRHEQTHLCDIYDRQLKRLAEMQERERYKESCQVNDELIVKQLEFALANSDIQIQSYHNFLNDCGNVINRLTKESLHFPNVLKHLEDEVNEQNGILDAMNKMGQPAYEDSLKNKKRLEKMEKRMQQEASKRQSSITAYKRNLLANEQNIFKHLPKDENFKAIAPDRYIQETSNVLELRLHHEQVEHDTMQLCDAAVCADINDLHHSVKDIFSKLKSGTEKVNFLEEKLKKMDDKICRAKQRKNELSYSITKDDLDVRQQTDKTNTEIDLNLKTRHLVETKAEYGSNELFKIQFALQHIVDLLRNVDGDRPIFRKEYPNEILSFPLFELHLGNYEDDDQPPETIEEDLDKLFKSAMDKIKQIMSGYKAVESADSFWVDCQKRHEQLILEELDYSPES